MLLLNPILMRFDPVLTAPCSSSKNMVEDKQVVMPSKKIHVRWDWRDKSLVAAYLEKSEEALNDHCFSMFGSKAVKKKLRNKKYMLIKWVLF